MRIVIISDLRVHLILSALFIFGKSKNLKSSKLLISERIIDNNDFGDFFPVWYKTIKFLILKLIFNINVIPKNNLTNIEEEDKLGIISSLCSITNDSLADRSIYPNLYESLSNLTKGAKEISQFIDLYQINEIYLFNGRTSSSEAIVRHCYSKNIQVNYYEYGSIFGYNFLLMPFPIHNAYKLTSVLIEFYKNNIFSNPFIFNAGKKFASNKLNNSYTNNYILQVEKEYDIAIFLCSDHEYTNVNPDIIGINPIGNFELCKKVVEKYGANKKYAVRAHPNQKNDPSYEQVILPILEFCKEKKIDFYGPASNISSYSLIKKCKIVAIELSSIGIDATLLGFEVDVFGNNNLKAIFDTMPEYIKSNAQLRREYVSEILGLSNFIYQIEFSLKYKLASKILYYLEYQIEKKINHKQYLN
ncbi:MAG: hypothetical protein WCG95_08810 [bacterium]